MTRYQRGFTLIELVVTMVVAGVVVGFMSLFLVTPVNSYLAQQRRAELDDSANNARRMLTQDIHRAVPWTVRYGSSGAIVAVEALLMRQAIHYRKEQPGPPLATELNFNSVESQFNVFGSFSDVPAGKPLPLTTLPYRLMVGYSGGNYPTASTITPAATTVRISRPAGGENEDEVTLSPAVTFTTTSGSKTIFVLDTPVKYRCDTTAGVNTLTRYDGYTFAPAFTTGVPAGSTSSVVARDVTACSVNTVPPTAQHGELVLLELTISRNGETVNVMHQAQVESPP